MAGQDLLSAALDECGLGDLFSSNPVIEDDFSALSNEDHFGLNSQISPQNNVGTIQSNDHMQTSSNSQQQTTGEQSKLTSEIVTSFNIGLPSDVKPQQRIQTKNINQYKRIIIKRVAPNGASTTQNLIIASNNNKITTTPATVTGRPNIITLKPLPANTTLNDNKISNSGQIKRVALNPANLVVNAKDAIQAAILNRPIGEPIPIIATNNNVIITSKNNVVSPAFQVVQTVAQPSAPQTTIIRPSNQFSTLKFTTTTSTSNGVALNPAPMGPQMVQLPNGMIYQLTGQIPNGLVTTDSGTVLANGNRVIKLKTIRTPLNVSLANQNSISSPTSPISPNMISPLSAPPISRDFSLINQPRTPLSAPPIVHPKPALPKSTPRPTFRSIPKAKSLIGNPNSDSLPNGRRIKAKGSGSNPSSPNSGLASHPRTPDMTIKSEEDKVDKAIMLEEVRRLIEDQEDEELANLETFAEYMPAKLKIGKRHPDLIVETASLSSIPPPDIYYRLSIPDEVIDSGALSALQLESIIYASQQHENILADGCRAGFLIGDGAGVGKGRTVAGIIYENYERGRKRSLWFSVSTDLKYDAERDLHDIGADKIKVYMINKFKYGLKIHTPENDNCKRGVIFATYSSLIGESNTVSGKYGSRMGQIIQWCGEDFDGVIIFDECHKAKNLFACGSTRATKTGQAVLELQNRLPKARVVYASATGATEPKNMGYMTRLGIWGPGTPFEDFGQFEKTVEKRGVGAMELVAIDLKMRGMYMARQLSFKGVSFKIEHVPLSREFIRVYNCCCRLWVSAKIRFEKALDLMGAESAVSKAIWTQFWASHQRFFKYLCIASKVKFAVAFVKEALRCDKAIVIGLQSTGEARTLEALDDAGGELSDFVSTAKAVFQSLLEKHFPAPNRKKLAKILGEDTSFFDQLGIKLSRNADDELVVSSYEQNDEDEQRKQRLEKAKSFFKAERDSDEDDDDFVSVSDDDDIFGTSVKKEENGEDSSDIDSDDLEDIDDIMDEKLGLKRKKSGGGGPSNALKFMDILLGPSSASAKRKKKKTKRLKAAPKKPAVPKQPKKSMRSKYEKFYDGFDQVGEDVGGYCENLRNELLEQLESFGESLPPNTLDELIDELGGPEQVAEMTGRKGRIVSTEDGLVQYEARTENDVSLDMLNLVEKQRFMDDEKRVAIISEAASSGISLHADRRAKNRCRRVHITVELPWSADRAIQQFGRTHRSNQVTAPEYVFLISNLAGEKRFASIVAKRLESLGALTHGDRRATESRDLSQFNIDTKYGRQALEIVMKNIAGTFGTKPLVPPPESYSGDFFEDCREGLAGVGLMNIDRRNRIVSLDKDYGNINKFLNRILGLEVELQNTLFRYFNDTMEAVVKQAKKSGKYDSGIMDLSSDVGNVEQLQEENYIMKSSSGAIKIQLHCVSIDRGISYEKAYNMYRQAIEEDDYFKDDIGFYVTNSNYQTRKGIFLAIPESPNKNQDVKQIFRIYKPPLGLQSKYETKSSLRERGEKMNDLKEVEKLWREHYDNSVSQCTHMLLFGRCRVAQAKRPLDDLMEMSGAPPSTIRPLCDVGLRKRTYCILSGSVLTVWPEIEKMVTNIAATKLQIVRLKTEDGKKYIGPLVPQTYVEDVRACLRKLANQ